ncbi:DEHA2E01848p [Debaryomyces hansenii CBS767]|uniref:DEHA2E01848p n=1 Tax=Debaryomyces hansenii (strain ATCC 36239 / CBS 767 / BCRC 21394 / JCM 1990 / NBRC 0083 / IGC 2968) TaxID=284592 RepID=Q6BQV9_DEBHA|nr:DEHA2E01848p [Debaryomyces hansenii CBS767]CAG87622.1 DEHA2E01848p [Debaryomyces hansenii CBS767]|eukprot:XP_459411.1 DEHA2E01848p [Debaryomyces hansenii CBS767]
MFNFRLCPNIALSPANLPDINLIVMPSPHIMTLTGGIDVDYNRMGLILFF